MCIARLPNYLLAISLSVVFTNAALAATDPAAPAALRALEAEAVPPAKVMRSESDDRTALLAGCPAATIGGGCEPLGLFDTSFRRNQVYRGNLFEIQEPATIAEFGFELDVDAGVEVCLYFSIHEAPQGEHTYSRTPFLPDDVQAYVIGNGAPTVYTTGTLAIPMARMTFMTPFPRTVIRIMANRMNGKENMPSMILMSTASIHPPK